MARDWEIRNDLLVFSPISLPLISSSPGSPPKGGGGGVIRWGLGIWDFWIFKRRGPRVDVLDDRPGHGPSGSPAGCRGPG